jgi:hypothetical protein
MLQTTQRFKTKILNPLSILALYLPGFGDCTSLYVGMGIWDGLAIKDSSEELLDICKWFSDKLYFIGFIDFFLLKYHSFHA